MSARCASLTAKGRPCKAYAVEGSTRCASHLGIAHRPTGLTPQVADHIVQLVGLGNLPEAASLAAGVSKRTYYAWLERGDPERADAAGAGYREFRKRVEEAEALAQAQLVARVMREARQGGWQAATWLLERRWPESWARISQRVATEEPPPAATDPLSQLDELAERRRAHVSS